MLSTAPACCSITALTKLVLASSRGEARRSDRKRRHRSLRVSEAVEGRKLDPAVAVNAWLSRSCACSSRGEARGGREAMKHAMAVS